jgi:hypothetical protein
MEPRDESVAIDVCPEDSESSPEVHDEVNEEVAVLAVDRKKLEISEPTVNEEKGSVVDEFVPAVSSVVVESAVSEDIFDFSAIMDEFGDGKLDDLETDEGTTEIDFRFDDDASSLEAEGRASLLRKKVIDTIRDLNDDEEDEGNAASECVFNFESDPPPTYDA